MTNSAQSQPISDGLRPTTSGAEPSAAHTPGPWGYTLGDVMRVTTRDQHAVCGVHRIGKVAGWGNEALWAANARLIAAAPDGLEAAMNMYVKLLRFHEIRHVIQPELCGLRDFIAKATGNEPQVVQDHYEAAAMILGPSAQDTTERPDRTREENQ